MAKHFDIIVSQFLLRLNLYIAIHKAPCFVKIIKQERKRGNPRIRRVCSKITGAGCCDVHISVYHAADQIGIRSQLAVRVNLHRNPAIRSRFNLFLKLLRRHHSRIGFTRRKSGLQYDTFPTVRLAGTASCGKYAQSRRQSYHYAYFFPHCIMSSFVYIERSLLQIIHDNALKYNP